MMSHKLMCIAGVAFVCMMGATVCEGKSKLSLSFVQVPRRGRGGKTTPKLIVDHADLGPVCELQCYETGPFQHGGALKNDDGSVVFNYKSGNMTCTATFTAIGDNRVQSLVEIKGPLDELRKIPYTGPCLQFQRSKLFTRKGPLQEFAARCFMYTMRGQVFLLDGARGKMTNFKPDSPENNPPMVQWYVTYDRMHPGSIWGVVGAAGDRPLYGLIACTSRDGKWVSAYAARYNLNIGQLYMPCIHVLPVVKKYLDTDAGKIVYKEMIYVMPNDPQKLLDAFREDFPRVLPTFEVTPTTGGVLRLKPTAANVPELKLNLNVTAGKYISIPEWRTTWWDTFINSGNSWRTWVHPHDDVLEISVSLGTDKWTAETGRAVAKLSGKGWTTARAPRGTAAQVLRTDDGKWTAAVFWERSEPGRYAYGMPAADQPDKKTISVRGKVIIAPTDALRLDRRKRWADMDWKNAKPYRMPVSDKLP